VRAGVSDKTKQRQVFVEGEAVSKNGKVKSGSVSVGVQQKTGNVTVTTSVGKSF